MRYDDCDSFCCVVVVVQSSWFYKRGDRDVMMIIVDGWMDGWLMIVEGDNQFIPPKSNCKYFVLLELTVIHQSILCLHRRRAASPSSTVGL